MTIEVLIVDDQKTVREILKGYVDADPGLSCIACASDGQEALDLVKVSRPDIVLMDIEMPVLDGLTATKIISEQFIDTHVLIISVHNEDSYFNTALQVGAKGYLLKNTPEKELINAIYSAHKGFFQLGPGLLDKYLHKVNNAEANVKELQQLKTAILQQSQVLENLNQQQSPKGRSNGNHTRTNNYKNQNYLEEQCINLEKQVYILSSRLDKVNKKIIFLQQAGIFMVLCCGLLACFVFLFSL